MKTTTRMKQLLLALALASPQLAIGGGNIDLATSFPDEALRNAVASYDYTGDGVLSDEEQGYVTSLSLSSYAITDLTGIELLTSLTSLYVDNNSLTSINLSKLVNLESLYAYDNPGLTTVTISGLEKLRTLTLYNCALTSVSLTGLPNLQGLYIYNNPDLTTLDVSKLTALEYLEAYRTGLTSIDVSGLTKLNRLEVQECPTLTDITAKGCTVLDGLYSYYDENFKALKHLTITGNTAMTSFYAYGDALESLDLTGCTELTYVYAYDKANLTTLKLDGCSKLTQVSVYNNPKFTTFSASGLDVLESLSLNNCDLTSVDLSNMPSLKGLYVYDNANLTTLDVSKLTELTNLAAYNTGLTAIDVSGLTKLRYLEVYNCQALTDITAKGCTVLDGIYSYYDSNFTALKHLTITGSTAITNFQASGEALETLDLTGCTELTYVYAYDKANLTMLKLDGCSKLTSVSVYNNPKFTTFSASGLDVLESLSLNNCDLTSVSLSNMPSLKGLYVYDNANLTTLDVSQLTNLESLSAYRTGLTSIDVSGLTKLSSLEVQECPALADITARGCTALSGIYSYYDSNFPALKHLTITGSEAMTSFSAYGEALESLDLSGCTMKDGGYIYVTDRPNLTSLVLDGCKARSMNIGSNPLLPALDLSKTDIEESLQIYSNPLLETVKLGKTGQLYAYENERLATVDVTALKGLTKVSSTYNNPALTQLDLSACNELEYADIYQNENLETLLVSSPVLNTLYCNKNKLAALDVSNCPALEALYCYDNLLTVLDVTKNTSLKTLNCYNNRLTALDLSKNTSLESASTGQYVDYDLVKLSAKEVGFAVNDSFDTSQIDGSVISVAYTEKPLKLVTVDGVRYCIVHENAATAESDLQDQPIYYRYKTGNEQFPLDFYVTVTGFTKAPSFLKVAPESVKGVYGGTVAEPTLTRSQDYNGTVTYKSANEAVVKVAQDGKLTVVGAGETTVTLSGVETEYRFAPADVTYGVVIEKASPVFKFEKDALEMVIQDEVPANKLDKGVYDGTVVYKSSDEAIAKIAADGKVTVIAAGEVTLTASGEATKNCNEPTAATYKLTIKKRTATLTIASAKVEGVYGGTVEAPALTLNGYDGKPTYATSNDKVVTVAADGKLTIVGAGEATITISAPETASYYAPAEMTYQVVIAKASPEFAFAEESIEVKLSDATVPENELTVGIYDGKVTYTSSDASIAEVDEETGVVTLKSAGVVTITATGAGTANCNGASASYTLKIAVTGDVNGDGKVDVADIGAIIDDMAAGTNAPAADVNGDGKVDVADIGTVIDIMAAQARLQKLMEEQ